MPFIEIKAAEREATTPEEPLVVRYYGEDFTCAPDINQWALMELAGSSADDEMAVMSAFMIFLRTIFVPEDWDRFRLTCRTNNVGFDELKPLIEGIAEAIAGRPTPQSSVLPDGPQPTTARSRVVSLSPGIAPRSA